MYGGCYTCWHTHGGTVHSKYVDVEEASAIFDVVLLTSSLVVGIITAVWSIMD